MIDRSLLLAKGGFSAVSRSITPERYFARQTANQNDGYSFVCFGPELGLSCDKSFDEQLSTAIRTRYPSLKQRLENLSVLALVEMTLFIGPIAMLVYALVSGSYLLSGICDVTIVISSLVLFRITKQAYDSNLFLSLFVYPLAFAYDVGLAMLSMWRYEFSEVVWKGRNVCIPVMQLEINPLETEKPTSSSLESK
jgi:hypothetical protein